jgi:alpha-glucosidase
VPNHTSDEHAWFQESRSSRDNPKRDWYIWRDPAPDGGPPNNWTQLLWRPGLDLRRTDRQYLPAPICQAAARTQLSQPEVLPAMLDVMRFWLDKGRRWLPRRCHLADDQGRRLRDEPHRSELGWRQPAQPPAAHLHANQPEVHDVIRQMRALLDEYDDRMMVGEIYLPNDQLMSYYGAAFDECHMPFNFQFINTRGTRSSVRRWSISYEADLPAGAWPNWVLGNHDQHRVATRVGPAQARVANMLLLTLRGTPTCYYGDELGMEDVPHPARMVQDPPAVNQPEIAHIVGRDPERTPMQWDDSAHAQRHPAPVYAGCERRAHPANLMKG